ncbi:hypothetical protein AGMMS49983_10870 [Clostridia bacterium]|nr:hypothetical protein AGMMS49983_10870 [Clostridia bacterium]
MYKMMIVDDEEIIRQGMSQIINWSNYGIELCATVSSAEEALRILNDTELSVMITDVRMSGMDGIALIRQALDFQPHLKCIVLSGYGEYELIRSAMRAGAVDYLLKPISREELSESIENVIWHFEKKEDISRHIAEQDLFQHTMQRIIRDEISLKERRERLAYFNINQPGEHIIFSLVRTTLQTEQVLSHFHNTSIDFIGKLIAFPDGKGNICVVFLFRNTQVDIESPCKILSESLQKFSESTASEVFGVVVPSETSFRQLKDIYRQCSLEMDCAIIYNSNKLIICEDSSVSFTDIMDSSRFRNYIINNDSSSVVKYIKELFRKTGIGDLCREANVLSVGIINQTIEIALANLVNPTEAYGIKTKSLLLLRNITELEMQIRVLFNAVSALSNLTVSLQSKNYSHLITLAVQYIDNEFKDCNLCLKTLADRLNVNPSYLGRLFKQETSEFFNDYLSRTRIRHSEQLLSTTNMKVSEIATAIGFTSVNYFEQVFKKITFSTPGNFRRIVHMDNKHL